MHACRHFPRSKFCRQTCTRCLNRQVGPLHKFPDRLKQRAFTYYHQLGLCTGRYSFILLVSLRIQASVRFYSLVVGKTNRFSARSHLLPSGFSHSFSGLFSWSGWFDAVDLGRKDILPGRCGLRIRATFEEANAVGNCLCRIKDVMRSELEQSVCSFSSHSVVCIQDVGWWCWWG